MNDKKIEHKSITKLLIAILVLLMLSSMGPIFAIADTSSSASTGYGDLLQYEWRETGADSENTHFSAGPAPNTPNVLWSIGAGSYPGQPSFTGVTYAWDGKIFSFSGSWIGAYDPFTGALKWNITMPSGWSAQAGTGGTPQAFRIDDQYGGIWTSRGPVFFNYKTGTLAGVTYFNTSEPGRPDISLGGGSVFYYAGFYNSEAKVFVRYARIMDTNEHGAVAFDCSNPTSPATIKWIFRANTPVEVLGSAGDLVMLGGYGEGEIYAVNATTGKLVWHQWKVGNCGYSGTAYDGMYVHGASSVFLTGYNATNGDVVWDYNAGERAYFVYGGAAAYGRYFAVNIAVDPSGYFGCWDIYTGKLLWKTPALWNIAYLTPCVGDEKVYVQRYSGTAAGLEAEQNGFMCMDALTGQILWELPGVSISHPTIAYGNLYVTFSGKLYCISDTVNSFPEWHGIPDNNGVAVGQYAPSNISLPEWTYLTDGPITGSPVAANGKVYFGSFDQNLYCVDADTGTNVWNYTVGYRIRSTPAVIGGVVYLGPDDGFVYAFDASTGTLKWKTPAPGPWTTAIPGEVTWSPAWQPRSCPIIDGGYLYVGSMDGKIYCLDANTGTLKWSRALGNASAPIGGTPAVANNVVYIADGLGNLTALKTSDGSIIWQRVIDTSQRRNVGTPIIVDDVLYIGTSYYPTSEGRPTTPTTQHRVAMINATSGELITSAQLTLSTGSTPAVFTPTFRASTTVAIPSGTALGGGVVNGVNQTYIVNGTQTRTYDMLFAVEGMQISAWAVLYTGTNLGNSTTGANSFIYNGTTMMSRVWSQWIGHQIFSSLTYVDDLTGPKIYGGSDVNSVTCLNATSGKPLSSYSTGAPVFGIIAVYDNKIYAASQDKMLYCFSTPKASSDMKIYANANKGGEMWNNETIVIAGKVAPPVTGLYPLGDFGSYEDNGLPNATVIISFTKPDGTSYNVNTQTDNLGFFNISYTPTEVGTWGWVAYYEGENKPWITYNEAYSEWVEINVTAAPVESVPTATPTLAPEETATPTATAAPQATETAVPTETAASNNVFGDLPVEYVYAVIAVVAIVIVVIAGYVYVKRKK